MAGIVRERPSDVISVGPQLSFLERLSQKCGFVDLDNQHWEAMERLMFQAVDHKGPSGLCVLVDAWSPKPARTV